jgi:hypothetical protein
VCALSRHKAELEKLKKQDPEFFKYLEQHGKDLLAFGQEDDDDEEEDEEGGHGEEEEEEEFEEEDGEAGEACCCCCCCGVPDALAGYRCGDS